MIIDLLQRRFYDIIKQASDKQLKIDTKIIFAPKTIIDIVADKERKDGPLFETESKGSAVVGHLPRVRPDYTFSNMAVHPVINWLLSAPQRLPKSPVKHTTHYLSMDQPA